MAYLNDYIYYSSGNETPEEYLAWGGLSILGHILGRKVSIKHGDYFNFHPNLLVCLVGEAGSGKNTALSVNMDIMHEQFQSHLVSASIQSREDVTYQMADDVTCLRTYTKPDGTVGDYRPFYILNNELASFLSVDKLKMVEFLTDVYDGKRFGTGFKKERIENPLRKQWFNRPHLSLIAGAVPSWFMSSLKMDLFSGGLGRRMIIVNAVRTKIIDSPMKPVGADAALGRVIDHLKEAEKFVGDLSLGKDGPIWWKEWYHKHRKEQPTDPIIYQFHQTMSMQVLKIACLLKCTESLDHGPVTADHLAAAEMLFKRGLPAIERLTSGIGRNELAGIGAQLLDFLNRTDGMASEIQIKKLFHRYARSPEFIEIINHYIEQGEVIRHGWKDKFGVDRIFYFTPEGFEKLKQMKQSASEGNEPVATQAASVPTGSVAP
jgi:hypothetical protein